MKRLALKIAIVYFGLMVIFNAPAFAKEGSSAADFLCEIGIEYYERGAYREALHELKKALLVEPQHEQALTYIRIVKEKLGLPEKEEIEQAQVSAEVFAREEAVAQALEEAEEKEAAEPVVEEEPVAEPSLQEGRLLPSEVEGRPIAPPVIASPEGAKQSPLEIASVALLPRNDEEEKETVSFSPLEKFDNFVEDVNEKIAPAKISGEYVLSLGGREGDVIWKDANADYNEANWRRIDNNFGINTYDTRVYDRLRLNLDTENEEGFNLHTNITIDPWTFIGKSDKVTVTSAAGGTAEIQLKYWSNTRSTINESVYSDRLDDVFSLPEVKVVDGKASASSGSGIVWVTGADTFNIPEMEIHRELWPVREFWLDYNSGDKFQFRFFPIAYQDQALTSDDPLGISNHMIYWEESPWLD
ncbi:MAG: hypothetical protein KKH11_06550, partial [Candidatus Omnitrophica bacterium]|nr:hypothetical protein [Candidatus Omnitrophota bacterium]